MKVGDTIEWARVFTHEDVRAFTAVVRDEGAHHVAADERGRLVVHGLLTGSLATRVGGALNYLAREMRFTFLRPVYTGERVLCVVTITELAPARIGTRMSADVRCTNDAGEVVLEGSTTGAIRRPFDEVAAMPPPQLGGYSSV